MIISERLRTLREQKKLTQGDLERLTGMLRCYVSRVENGHTVPSLGTLEKWAYALGVPLYRLFYDGGDPPTLSIALKGSVADGTSWGSVGKESRMLSQLRSLLERMEEKDRRLLLHLAQKMAIFRTANRANSRARRKHLGISAHVDRSLKAE